MNHRRQMPFVLAAAALALAVPMMSQQANKACCVVASTNAASNVAMGRVNSTGQTFGFRLTNGVSVTQLHAGQPIYANFSTKEISLDGQHTGGAITQVAGQAPGDSSGSSGRSETGKSENAAQSSAPGDQAGRLPGKGQFAYIRAVDPCSVVSDPNLLKSVAGSAVTKAFPFTSKTGPYSLTVYDPHLANITCPTLHIWIDAHVRFERTDILHFETHGTTSFDSIVVGHVVSTVPPSQAITAATFQSAVMCFTDIHFDTFNLQDVPNALDNWIRGEINKKVTAKDQCRDVTAQIAAFLQVGGTIPPQSQSTSSGRGGVLVPSAQKP
ncbi:MAG: hypothetical protein ACJ71Q_13860 [Terriglobales bacterium]